MIPVDKASTPPSDGTSRAGTDGRAWRVLPDSQTDRLDRAAEAAFLDIAFARLHSDIRQAAQARAFLVDSGCVKAALGRLPLGLCPPRRELLAQLEERGFDRDTIHRCRLAADPRLEGMLVAPLLEASGRMVTFWGRPPVPQAGHILLRDRWRERVPAFGLDMATQSGADEWIVVERFLDAVVFWSRGCLASVALGDAFTQIDAARWRALAAGGARRFVLLSFGHHDDRTWQVVRRQLRRAQLEVEFWSIPIRRLAPRIDQWLRGIAPQPPQTWIAEHRVPLYIPGEGEILLNRGATEREATNEEQKPTPRAGQGPTKPTEAPKSGGEQRPRRKQPRRQAAPVPAGKASPGTEEECPLHHCAVTDCFCFD